MKERCRKGAAFLLVYFMLLSLFGNDFVYASEDVSATISKGMSGAIAYLQREYPESYQYGYEWILYTLLRSGTDVSQVQMNAYYNSVVKEVKTWNGTQKPTDMERVALALSVLGKDITNVEGVNLAAMIYNSTKLGSGSNELTYALLALDAQKTAIPETAKWSRNQMIDKLLEFQNENGGFGLFDNNRTGVDTTAMALQALAPYTDKEEISSAVEKALSYLKSEQSKDGGFGSPEAAAQVVIALSALGKDVLDASEGFGDSNSNIIVYLDGYYLGNPSGFAHTLGKDKPDSMATIQVLQAYTSYMQYMNRTGSYWDLSAMKGKDMVIPTTIAFEKDSYSLYATQELQLQVICSDAMDRVDEYTSSDTKVVTVTDQGVLVGLKAGTAKITAVSASGVSADVVVTVKTPKIKLSTTKGKLQVKKSTNALKVAEKLDTDKVVKWTSSNTKVATVSSKGKITAKKAGTANIAVTMKSGATAKCKVTVQKKAVTNGVKFKKKVYKICVDDKLNTECKLANSFDMVKSYKSSNKKVVTISKTGVLKGIKPGTANVTVKTRNGAMATVKVIVR